MEGKVEAIFGEEKMLHSLMLPSSSPHPFIPPHHPLAHWTSPQKSSDSWKVLGVYSVTTKQNHLKTKWAHECARATQPLSLCGLRKKKKNKLSESRGWRVGMGKHNCFIPYIPYPLSTLSDRPSLRSSTAHAHTFKCVLQTHSWKQSSLCWSLTENDTCPSGLCTAFYFLLFPFALSFETSESPTQIIIWSISKAFPVFFFIIMIVPFLGKIKNLCHFLECGFAERQ